MSEAICQKCGCEAAADVACPGCGHAVANGAPRPAWVKPPPPPEAADWVITPTPPDVLKHLRDTFDEMEFIAELREAEQSGGAQIDALISEIEQQINGSA